MYSYSALYGPVRPCTAVWFYRQRGTGIVCCMAPYISFLLYAGLYGEGDVRDCMRMGPYVHVGDEAGEVRLVDIEERVDRVPALGFEGLGVGVERHGLDSGGARGSMRRSTT